MPRGTRLLLTLLLWPSLVWSAGAMLRIGNGNEPETLDPQRVEGVSASNIVRDLYEGLTALSPRGELIAGAAERWDISPDGREYRFQLRPSARWSNGDPLTAEDFVAGLRRSVEPATGSAYAQMLTPIVGASAVIAGTAPPSQLGVRALDVQTLVIQLHAPTPYFLGLLAHPSSFPNHRPSLEKWGRDFSRPGRLVSNGAYALEQWVPQGQVRLRRNRHYWNDARTGIDQVEFRPSEDANSELKRYRADELDITYEIPLLQAPWLRANLGRELRIAPYIGTYFYGFNCLQPPFMTFWTITSRSTASVSAARSFGLFLNGGCKQLKP